MSTSSDLALALHGGMNEKIFLQALQMPQDMFRYKLNNDIFTPKEMKVIKKLVKEWSK